MIDIKTCIVVLMVIEAWLAIDYFFLSTSPFVKRDVLDKVIAGIQQALSTTNQIYWTTRFYPDYAGMSLGTDTVSIYQNRGLFRRRKLLAELSDSGTLPDFLGNNKYFCIPIEGKEKILIEKVLREHLN